MGAQSRHNGHVYSPGHQPEAHQTAVTRPEVDLTLSEAAPAQPASSGLLIGLGCSGVRDWEKNQKFMECQDNLQMAAAPHRPGPPLSLPFCLISCWSCIYLSRCDGRTLSYFLDLTPSHF